jgi:hypothetical protein
MKRLFSPSSLLSYLKTPAFTCTKALAACLLLAANHATQAETKSTELTGTPAPKAITMLKRYKEYLHEGTLQNQDWSQLSRIPKTRYATFRQAFEHFEKNNGKIIVELGTTRSFVHGGLPGCNSDNPAYWTPNNPANWDWGAGCFTRMAGECLQHTNPIIHTVDLAWQHIERCKIVTKDFAHLISYHVNSSEQFLRSIPYKVDLLYLDTGDMTPIEPTAQLQLREAQIIVERDLIAPNGIILIDDVRNQTPKKFGELSDLGKAKYSIPYLLAHGFEMVADEYQVILKKAAR